MRSSTTVPRALLIVLALAGTGCASVRLEGDRFYMAGDLARAEKAYRSYLESGPAAGEARARARYRLGLIYALPDNGLHDWEAASRTLRALIESEPGSAWARQAELLLSMHEEQRRLERELETRDSRVSALLSEVVQLKKAAEEAGADAEDQRARVEGLTLELARLRREIGELGERLAAREKELERIKRIDLQIPP